MAFIDTQIKISTRKLPVTDTGFGCGGYKNIVE